MKHAITFLVVIMCMAFTSSKIGDHKTFVELKRHNDDSNRILNTTMKPLDIGINSSGLESSPIHRRDLMLFPVKELLKARIAGKSPAGFTKQGRPVDVYFFPGKSEKRALVIGGVHGSELSAVEVATALLTQLQEREATDYSVLVIPSLFPDNVAAAKNNASQIGITNAGRYTNNSAIDPNRQMPAPGKPFNDENPVDYLRRDIEIENKLLLKLINDFRPTRIVNIHAIRDVSNAGIYADPRSDHRGYALGFETDSSLAIKMAKSIDATGWNVPGNRLNCGPTALYHSDPPPAATGEWQKRNLHGSNLPCNRGRGVSLGSWASTGVHDERNAANNRAPIRLITMEFPGCKRPVDYADPMQQELSRNLVELYASAIVQVFLANNFAEEAY